MARELVCSKALLFLGQLSSTLRSRGGGGWLPVSVTASVPSKFGATPCSRVFGHGVGMGLNSV